MTVRYGNISWFEFGFDCVRFKYDPNERNEQQSNSNLKQTSTYLINWDFEWVVLNPLKRNLMINLHTIPARVYEAESSVSNLSPYSSSTETERVSSFHLVPYCYYLQLHRNELRLLPPPLFNPFDWTTNTGDDDDEDDEFLHSEKRKFNLFSRAVIELGQAFLVRVWVVCNQLLRSLFPG